jgi:restriction system protein
MKVLAECPPKIDLAFLQRFPSYVVEWRRGSAAATPLAENNADRGNLVVESSATPEEQISKSYQTLTAALEADLLDRVREMSPEFFETLVVNVLIKLGYGGGQPAMGQAIGRSGDGGIDGIIKEDALGLDVVYIQAKRYGQGNSVGRSDVQAFAGSLDGVGATKGIFITTGSFSTGAREYVARIAKRIILIDGPQFARLMVENEVGVRVLETFKIKKIDENYFTET